MKVIAAIITILLSITSVSAEKPQPLSIMGLNGEETALFMSGLAFGITSFDAQLYLSKKESLYCAPMNAVVNAQVLWELAEKALQGPHRPQYVALAALDELAKKYPCKR
jgi:hypothetical protein